ncbi:Protein kinase domain-containing protein [Aphelenchoides besseyi]|nr:Protein kinase domain-containing protein [Aphelenchoides besseyi]
MLTNSNYGAATEAAILRTFATPSTSRNLRAEKIGSYRIGNKLGSGNFAKVRAATHEVAKTKVAIKDIDIQPLDAENLTKVKREVQILQGLSHPHIIKLYEIIRTDKHLYIVTELATGGELFDLLMYNGRQNETEARRIFQQLTSAVAYCHANGIVHRDLKAENILLDREGNVKLIDFGFSNFQQNDLLLSTWCGSPPYAAPELLLAQEYDGRMSDVWSLGVVLFILVTAEFPFQGGTVDNLKMAVLGELLNIPFFVSVECADLLRKMLTVNPEKRANLSTVIQHRWFTVQMPPNIRELLSEKWMKRRVHDKHPHPLGQNTPTKQLDPTVLLFMQQHTIWPEEKIAEDVMFRNYESPVYATYELLNDKLAKLKDADSLQTDSDQPRRGSRGSILSGKANVEPDPKSTTIPAHHLAQLSLSTSSDCESDESSNSEEPGTSTLKHNSPQKQRARGCLTGGTMLNANEESEWSRNEHRRHTLCASDRLPANPLAAMAQQWAADPESFVKATTAFIQQSQQQSHPLNQSHFHQSPLQMAAAMQILQEQQQQHAQQTHSSHQHSFAANNQDMTVNPALLGLMGLRNGLIDYTRMMRIPTSQERRASANEAQLGLHGYANLLGTCSSMGINPHMTNGGKDRKTSNSVSTNQPGSSSSTLGGPSSNEGQRITVEEEGASYLSRYGTHKRNTVHALATPLNFLGPTAPHQRYARTPYAKQSISGASGNERRSSWASSTNAAHLNPQQYSRLENIYAQSIRSGSNATTDLPRNSLGGGVGGSEQLNSIQQLQLEFQKLRACTERPAGNSNSKTSLSGMDASVKTPTISITDENNRSLAPSATSYDPMLFMAQNAQAKSDTNTQNNGQRPATVIGFSTPNSSASNSPTEQNIDVSQTITQQSSNNKSNNVKFVFIPVSLNVALDRVYRFVRERQLVCEVRPIEETGDSMEVRIAPSAQTIVSLILHKLPNSPNISKTEFSIVQGDAAESDVLRTNLMSVFNEVY